MKWHPLHNAYLSDAVHRTKKSLFMNKFKNGEALMQDRQNAGKVRAYFRETLAVLPLIALDDRHGERKSLPERVPGLTEKTMG